MLDSEIYTYCKICGKPVFEIGDLCEFCYNLELTEEEIQRQSNFVKENNLPF